MLDAETLARGLERIDERMRSTHSRLAPGCAWLERADAIDVDGWRWFGCADHAPSTDSGLPSRKQTDRARAALRKGTDR